MKKANFYSDNDDLKFHLEKKLDFSLIFSLLSKEQKQAVSAETAQEYLANWRDILEGLGEICGSTLAPRAATVEKEPIALKDGQVSLPNIMEDNLKILKDFGVPSFSVSAQHGGMGAPFFIDLVGAEMMNRACPSTMLNAGWYGSIAHILDLFATPEVKAEYIPLIAQGLCSGSMSLTESGAGSDLSAIGTYGVKQEGDGFWRLYGEKIFITNGNGDISLVLAKSEKGAKGLDKLSLFLCPRIKDGKANYKITKVEEKIGLHGSATCALEFDGSWAILLGEENKGYRYMLHLMNDSRIAVGYQGLGLMEACYRLAHDYAQTRTTWGRPIIEHELIKEMLLQMDTELRAIRSVCYQTAYARSVHDLAEKRSLEYGADTEEGRHFRRLAKEHSQFVRRLTPLIKYWVGEQSVIQARRAVQILGGYGYTTEYRAEWWVRESLIYSLYEGTSQIQALMCMKDTLKEIMAKPSKLFARTAQDAYHRLSDPDPLMRKLYGIRYQIDQTLYSILFSLVKTNFKVPLYDKDWIKKLPQLAKEITHFSDLTPALAHAERFCEMKCYHALAESLIQDASMDESRRVYAERFLSLAVPKVNYLKACIEGKKRLTQI